MPNDLHVTNTRYDYIFHLNMPRDLPGRSDRPMKFRGRVSERAAN